MSRSNILQTFKKFFIWISFYSKLPISPQDVILQINWQFESCKWYEWCWWFNCFMSLNWEDKDTRKIVVEATSFHLLQNQFSLKQLQRIRNATNETLCWQKANESLLTLRVVRNELIVTCFKKQMNVNNVAEAISTALNAHSMFIHIYMTW